MVFASLIFLCIFLPLNLALYYTIKDSTFRNLCLILFSLVFYAWGEPVWVLLLIFSATVDYLNGLWIERHHGTAKAKLGLVSSIVINLGLLIAFKYSGFIYENINVFLPHDSQLIVPSFTLPIGISFYTFQTISYSIDVYRGEVKAQRSYIKFLMFVSLYHQLVAGPIVRYAHIAHEIDHRKLRTTDIGTGLNRFLVGLFKKVAIANVAGQFVKDYLVDTNLSDLSMGEAWFAIIMFSIQIYFDFSGYSDMAIGLGRMFGFHYYENFNYPYIARSATDFWRRWHISLGTFFRDYVYIPLGGNRKNGYFNLFVVWALTGLWHGPSWNFILWGLYFGTLILIERLFLFKVLDRLPKIVGHVYLLLAAIFGWALFYFTDFAKLLQFLTIMIGQSGQALWNYELTFTLKEHVIWLVVTLILCTPVYLYVQKKIHQNLLQGNFVLGWVLTLLFQLSILVYCIVMLVGSSYNPFLYYRF